MAGDPVEVRYLCENVQDLTIPPNGAHPAGAGLPGNLQYVDGVGRPHRLPKSGESLDRIKAQLSGPAASTMSAKQSEMAWHRVLATPSLVVPLQPPSTVELLEKNIVVPSEMSVRQIALASVVRCDGQIAEPLHPVASVIRLVTAAARGRESSPSHAWLIPSWHGSINGLARELEVIWLMAGPAVQNAPKDRRATLLMADSTTYSDVQIARMRATCSVFGYALTCHREAAVAYKRALGVLRDQPPGLLLRAQTDPSGVLDSLADEYRRANSNGRVLTLGGGDEGWLPDLREGLAQSVGVTAGLMPTFLAEDAEETADSGAQKAGLRALTERFPNYVKRARHAAYGHFVQDADGSWYSHDQTKHGASVFKLHLEISNALHWQADLDGNLEVIDDKHKGPTGRVIELGELNFAG